VIYAQFFHKSAISNDLIEACGDRSVIILDGRSPKQHRGEAGAECMSRGYKAWQLMRGPRFTDSQPISEIVEVPSFEDVKRIFNLF